MRLLLAMFTVVLSSRPRLKLPTQTKPTLSSISEKLICDREMGNMGIDISFASAIAHRAHSLTSEDVEHYFKSDKPNHIPTVNPDLTVRNLTRVLLYAPEDGYDREFATIAMRHTDKVLSKMNRENWVVKYYSVLEKLVHSHHMAELWTGAKSHYDEFNQKGLPKELCRCLSDIKNNGVLKALQLMALKIKYPGITSGNFDLDSLKQRWWSYSLSYSLSYSFSYSLYLKARDDPEKAREIMEFQKKLRHFDFSGDEEDVVRRVASQLVDGDKGLQKRLTSEEGWSYWKEGFHNMMKDNNGDRTFGMFMYCMLNGEDQK